MDTPLESVLADKLLAGCAVYSLECEGLFVPHILPAGLEELVIHVSARNDDASEHLHMIMHRIGSLQQLSSLELQDVDCDVNLPASLALPPSLEKVTLQLRPTSETDGSLELGAFSRVPAVSVDVAVWDSVMPDSPCLQSWLLPGLLSLRSCKDLYLDIPAASAAHICAALADFSCDSCRLGTVADGWHPESLVLDPIRVLPKARKVTFWPWGPLVITWQALSSGGGVRALLPSNAPVAVLGYTGLLPAEPWVLVVDQLHLTGGLPIDKFVKENADAPFNRPVWTLRSTAGLDMCWQWFSARNK